MRVVVVVVHACGGGAYVNLFELVKLHELGTEEQNQHKHNTT